ncbi:MAG TPA: MOSC domain-containing protein [Candidatus Methylomirabilis sp.]|nr:MOSC domain-containing protein [Candidatus Methylomirabilis sp.]
MSTITGVIVQISVSNGGVPKHAIERAIVWEEGLDGDRQADRRFHGGPTRAVCLYSFEVIEKMRAEGHAIAPGAAGENVTVGGLDWSLVVPGVEMRLGNDVRLEVTAYAKPCWKNAQWFQDGAVDRMSQSRHPGESRVYARVLGGGEIRVGDPAELIALDAVTRTAKQRVHTYRWPQDFA